MTVPIEPEIRLSATRFKTFEMCPAMWHFENVVEPDRASTYGEAAAIGTAIHAAIEKAALRRCVVDQDTDDFVERAELLEHLNVWLIEKGQPLSETAKAEAVEVIQGFAPIDLGCQAFEPEHEWSLRIDGIDQDIKGQWDFSKISNDGERVKIIDWKTGRWVPTDDEFANDRQVGLYLMAARATFPEAKTITAEFHYLREGVVMVAEWSPDLDRYQRAATRGTAALMLRQYKKASLGDHCKLCDFRMDCDAFTSDIKDEAADELDAHVQDFKNAELLAERYRVAQRVKLLTKYKEDLDRALTGRMEAREASVVKIGGHMASYSRRSNKVLDGARVKDLCKEIGIPFEAFVSKAAKFSVTKARAMVETPEQIAALDEYVRKVSNSYLVVRKSTNKKRKKKGK